jgi:hypothetical protein
MKTLRILYYMAISDFYQRARSYRFLLILASVIGMGVLVNNGTLLVHLMPKDSSLYNSLSYRGEYNSAWVGAMTVLVVNTFLGFLGFYLVKDCIERDIRTRVGQIIATTPVSRAAYLIGKWISNCLVLYVMVLILAVAAVIMVLLRGEASLDLGALLMPFLAFTLPLMTLIAALAVVFETVPWLRGVMGNVVYFFVGILLITFLAVWGKNLPLRMDPLGMDILSASITEGAQAAFPNETANGISIGFATPGLQSKVFNWPGLAWTADIVGGQWLWAVLGLGLVMLSALWFSRFDPSREGVRRARAKSGEAKECEPARPQKKAPRIALPNLSPIISKLARVNPFLGVLFAELRMLLNGRRWWWWAIVAGVNVAILSSPLSTITSQYLLPFTWLWPLAIWSGMGNRERKKNTAQIVFSSARPVLRQLPAAWLAGVLATALLEVAGVAVFLSNGDLAGLVGWAGAVVFVPTLALALGVFSSGNRVFEVVYLVWWYLGPFQKTQGIDFTAGTPQVYLLAAAGLLLLSACWRSRQVRV